MFVSTVLPIIAAETPEISEQASTTPDFLVPVFGFGLGWVLVGGVIMRSAILPRWSGLLLILGLVLFIVSEAGYFETSLSHVLVTVDDIIFSLGLVWIGYNNWTRTLLTSNDG